MGTEVTHHVQELTLELILLNSSFHALPSVLLRALRGCDWQYSRYSHCCFSQDLFTVVGAFNVARMWDLSGFDMCGLQGLNRSGSYQEIIEVLQNAKAR